MRKDAWMNILFRNLTFLFKISFFYWSYLIIKFSETLNFGFSLSVAIIIKISRNKGLKYLTLCVMNRYNIWVSLSEMSDKTIDIFHDILFWDEWKLVCEAQKYSVCNGWYCSLITCQDLSWQNIFTKEKKNISRQKLHTTVWKLCN